MKNYTYHRDYRKEQAIYKTLDKVLIKRLLKYLYPYRIKLSFAIFLLFISKGIEAFVPVYIGAISEKILNSIGVLGLNKAAILQDVYRGCFTAAALLFLSYLLNSFSVYLKSSGGQKAILELRSEVYRHIVQLPVNYFDKHAVGKLMTRTIHDIDQIDQMFSESVVPLIGNVFLFFCIFAGIFITSWEVAIGLALIMPLTWWLTNHFRVNQRKCYELVRGIVSAMNSFVQEHLMGASTIRNLGLQKKEKRQFDEINDDHCNAYLESIHNFSFFIAGIDFLTNLALITVFAILIYIATPGSGFQAGMYFTFSLYVLMVFRPLVDLAERYNILQSAMAASERVFNVLDAQCEPKGPDEALDLSLIDSIVFEDVWFAYKGQEWVLKGISFALRKGESMAVVGMTGAGKSTLMGLLLRFYDCQKGAIKINGRDIRHYRVSSLRKQFSVVLQDPVIFTGTIAENISLHNPLIGREQIDKVIGYIKMGGIVERQPEGVDYLLSEHGKGISVGEMQLISMARAIAHERSMLILDEATANIDSHTEQIIQDALKKILTSRTSLVVAHRLSTIKDVNWIIVLHDGCIAESGTHAELLARKGIYEKLYRLQFQPLGTE